jgi:predicted NACHT family NTPase
VISELALSLLANILSDTAKETLGKHYDPSLKAYKNAIKSLSDKYRLNITQIETFLHQENVKVAIKEYLENPNNHDLLNSLTDEFLSSFNENKFLKERESSILSEFFEFLYTEIKKDPELRNYLQHYLIRTVSRSSGNKSRNSGNILQN